MLLPNADPGFDWIFSRNIAGFVTAYGGVNSHMAVRASELGLPAVIGAGETLYAEVVAGPPPAARLSEPPGPGPPMTTLVAVTQRVVVDARHGERSDALDQRWTRS